MFEMRLELYILNYFNQTKSKTSIRNSMAKTGVVQTVLPMFNWQIHEINMFIGSKC